MNSYTFASEIVIPTVKEALADRANRRRIYIAGIVTYHLVDYIAAEAGLDKSEICENVRKVCKPAFDVVQGACHGTKHAGNATRGYRFKPGEERNVPAFAFDSPGVGWGHGRWDVPGLSVENGGAELFLDTCLQIVLFTCCKTYENQLGILDLSFLDRMVLEAKPFKD
ncbi:MAG: hypothetical protein J2P49_08880 [Methylocapsa sp.]|nr:hypothetical protein [Methylocapsa sp.]